MSMRPEIKRGAFPRHLTAILSWRDRHVDRQSSGRRGARTWSSRAQGLVLSGALTLGTLAGVIVAAPAYAGTTQIQATGGPGDVVVSGSGFTPGTRIRLEALTTGLTVLQTIYFGANSSGEFSGEDINGLSPGKVFVAADGEPGPTAWAEPQVLPLPTLFAESNGCPDPGGVSVYGDYFQPGATVRLEILAANSSWVLGSVVATEMVQVNNYGAFNVFLDPDYSGHAYVAADEDVPGATTTWTSLGSVCY
jgi:hypothetical protein